MPYQRGKHYQQRCNEEDIIHRCQPFLPNWVLFKLANLQILSGGDVLPNYYYFEKVRRYFLHSYWNYYLMCDAKSSFPKNQQLCSLLHYEPIYQKLDHGRSDKQDAKVLLIFYLCNQDYLLTAVSAKPYAGGHFCLQYEDMFGLQHPHMKVPKKRRCYSENFFLEFL